MMENMKVDQKVWFKSQWVDVNSGIVTKICSGNARGYVEILTDTEHCTVRVQNCYPTEDALLASLKEESERKVKEYCDFIMTVDDLVRFCYEHNMSAEEYTDYDARKAAKIKAKELLGIELDD